MAGALHAAPDDLRGSLRGPVESPAAQLVGAVRETIAREPPGVQPVANRDLGPPVGHPPVTVDLILVRAGRRAVGHRLVMVGPHLGMTGEDPRVVRVLGTHVRVLGTHVRRPGTVVPTLVRVGRVHRLVAAEIRVHRRPLVVVNLVRPDRAPMIEQFVAVRVGEIPREPRIGRAGKKDQPLKLPERGVVSPGAVPAPQQVDALLVHHERGEMRLRLRIRSVPRPRPGGRLRPPMTRRLVKQTPSVERRAMPVLKNG